MAHESLFKTTALRMTIAFVTVVLAFSYPTESQAADNDKSSFIDYTLSPVYDIDKAKNVCDELPLDDVEGIWLYPDDNVTVLIRRLPPISRNSLDSYQLMVVDASDSRLTPGMVMGTMDASSDPNKFVLIFITPDGKGKKDSCTATMANNKNSMIITREKLKFNLRLNLNPNSLLPTLWKSLLRFGISVGNGGDKNKPAPGMVRLYPSSDGEKIVRRGPTYL